MPIGNIALLFRPDGPLGRQAPALKGHPEMTSAASGAVFFLGTRAHYQALQPPDQMGYDIENGNEADLAECGWIHCTRSDRSRSNMLLLEYRCEEPSQHNTGVTRRFRGRRAQDGSNERILNEDMDPVGLHNLSYRDSVKSKESAASGRCASLRALLSNLKRRKRKPSTERAPTHLVCTYRDSCRCLECQSRYFDCDETDSCASSDSYDDYDLEFDLDYDCNAEPSGVAIGAELAITDDRESSSEDEDEEVFIDTPPDNVSTDALIAKKSPTKEKMSVSSDENGEYGEEPLQWEMAAGTPIVLDYLLNHPIMCSIQ